MAKYIAVIGDAETVKGFAAVGLDIFPCDDFEHAAKLLRNLTDGDRYAIIYLTEEVYLSVEKGGKRAGTLRPAADSRHYPHSQCQRKPEHRQTASFLLCGAGGRL